MDLFSKTKPDLVNHKTLKKLNKIFQTAGKPEPTWNESMNNFYSNYIKPNLFPIIVLLLLIVFLTIRYVINQEKKQKHKKNKKKYKSYKYKINYVDDMSPVVQEQVFDIKNTLHDDEYIDDEDENSIYNIEQSYQKTLRENDGSISDQMIKELYENKTSKMSFDELARVIGG